MKKLREAGLNVGVSASPLVPGITDGEGELEAVAEAAKLAGAQWFFSGVLFLMPASAKTFLPFIREKFPKLAKQYQEWYSKNGYAPEDYRKKASERVLRIRQKYGFSVRPWEGDRPKSQAPQMKLAWDAAAISKRTPVHAFLLRRVAPASNSRSRCLTYSVEIANLCSKIYLVNSDVCCRLGRSSFSEWSRALIRRI